MFSSKNLIGLLASSLLITSCAPLTPLGETKKAPAKPVPQKVTKPQVKKSSSTSKKEAARIKANKEAAARRARLKKKRAAEARAKRAKAKARSSSSSSNSSSSSKPTPKKVTPPTPKKKPVVKPKSKYRTAMSIPGKPGFVFNPWTNKAVDVRGIPGGSVVRDPNDGNPDHKFRVP